MAESIESGVIYAKLILWPHVTIGIPLGVISLIAETASSPPHTLTQSALAIISEMISLRFEDTLSI